MMALSTNNDERPNAPIHCIKPNMKEKDMEPDNEKCGNWMAFPYFISFSLLCTFLVSILYSLFIKLQFIIQLHFFRVQFKVAWFALIFLIKLVLDRSESCWSLINFYFQVLDTLIHFKLDKFSVAVTRVINFNVIDCCCFIFCTITSVIIIFAGTNAITFLKVLPYL